MCFQTNNSFNCWWKKWRMKLNCIIHFAFYMVYLKNNFRYRFFSSCSEFCIRTVLFHTDIINLHIFNSYKLNIIKIQKSGKNFAQSKWHRICNNYCRNCLTINNNLNHPSLRNFTCKICNGQYDYSHKSIHLKSKKHRNALGR